MALPLWLYHWFGRNDPVYLIITGIMGIGAVIPIAITPKNQRLGDLAAGTVIVNTKSTMSVEDTVFMDMPSKNYKPLYPDVMKLSDGDINTIKSVITQAKKNKNEEMCRRVDAKIKEVLHIQSDLPLSLSWKNCWKTIIILPQRNDRIGITRSCR